MAFSNESTGHGTSRTINDDNETLLRREFEYRSAGKAAFRAVNEATNATNTLKTLTCHLEKIKT